jgi:hypothetical protein
MIGRPPLPGLQSNQGQGSVDIRLMASSDAGSEEDETRSEEGVPVCEPEEMVELELSCSQTF